MRVRSLDRFTSGRRADTSDELGQHLDAHRQAAVLARDRCRLVDRDQVQHAVHPAHGVLARLVHLLLQLGVRGEQAAQQARAQRALERLQAAAKIDGDVVARATPLLTGVAAFGPLGGPVDTGPSACVSPRLLSRILAPQVPPPRA